MALLSTTVTGQGADLVLLHGWGANSRIWDVIIPDLAESFRVTAIDLPGHGGSPALGTSALSAWVAALLQVAPQHAVWMGWSLGGVLATVVGHDRAERVSAVVTIGSSLKFVRDESWPEAIPDMQLQEMARSLMAEPEATLRRFIALQFLGVGMEKSRLRQIQNAVATAPVNVAGLLAGLELLQQLDNRSRIPELEMPLTMIFGENDKLVPVAVVRAIHDLAPAVETKVITRAGHAPFLSHSQQFLDLVLPCLQRHAG